MLARTSSRVVWSTVDRIGLKSSKIKLLNFITTVRHVDRTLTPIPVLSSSSLRKFVSRHYFIRAAALRNHANIGCSEKTEKLLKFVIHFSAVCQVNNIGILFISADEFSSLTGVSNFSPYLAGKVGQQRLQSWQTDVFFFLRQLKQEAFSTPFRLLRVFKTSLN